jgi:4-hydroxybenzoyl-CoA thioesterase
METRIKEFGRSSFSVQHRVSKGGALALEGFEKRVWTVRDPGDKNRLRSAPIPAEVLAGFETA